MPEEKYERIDERKLPLFYRLILKLPKPNLDFLPEFSQGLFWAVVVPVFLVMNFFLGLFLLLGFPFPVNILTALIIPTAIILVFLRITLERFISWWNNIVATPGFEWKLEKFTQEYFDLLEKHRSKKK